MGHPRKLDHSLKIEKETTVSPYKQQLCALFKSSQKGGCICGMCGKSYSIINEGLACLEKDLQKVKSIPIIGTKTRAKFFYCLICSKSYVNEKDTAICMVENLKCYSYSPECKEYLTNLANKIIENENITKRKPLISRRSIPTQIIENKTRALLGSDIVNLDLISEIVQKEAEKKAVPVHKENVPVFQASSPLSMLAPEEAKTTNSAPIQKEKINNSNELSNNNPQPKATPTNNNSAPETGQQTPEGEKQNILYRFPGQKAFKRHDARYVCTVCLEKFFTKAEVESHFLEHPLKTTV